MAHALSIIDEAGDGGFEYDSAINSVLKSHRYASIKRRWTFASSPEFDWKQFRIHMIHAVREGLVDAGAANEQVAKGELAVKKWRLFLTLKGFAHVEEFDRPVLHRWGTNVSENLPTVLLSVVSALAIAWLLDWAGPGAALDALRHTVPTESNK